jgi:hypothetical protein
MTTLTNSFEGGTSGTTITAANSGGASGNAFDSVSIGTSGSLVFDNARAAHGLLSAKAATGGTADEVLMEWTTSLGTQATVYYRAYLYLTSNSAAVQPVEVRAGGSSAASIAISTSGNLRLVNGAFAVVMTFSGMVPLGQWFRLEGLFTGDPSNGVISCSQFNSMDSVTPTESHTLTGQDTTGSLTQTWFGQTSSVANTPAFWLDDVGVSSSGPLGPWTPPGGAGCNIVAPLVASGAI